MPTTPTASRHPMHHPPLRRLLVLVVALLGLTATAPAGAAAATFGTQDDIGGPTASTERIEATLATARRAGAKIFRVEANWSGLEPERQGVRDATELAALDRLVDAVSRYGMKTLLFVNRTPCWASSAPASVRRGCDSGDVNRFAVWRYQPQDPASVVPISTFLAARYASKLAAFQVWNEPDQANEKYWAGPDKVRNYVRMTRALYKPLKRAAPKVPVLAGSFIGTDGRWLKAMYKAGVKGTYDALAVQFYSAPLNGLRVTRQVQAANRDKKPLWLTEFGFTSCLRAGGPAIQLDQRCVTRAGQAQGVTDLLTAIKRRTWIKAAILYDVSDDGQTGYTFGLVDVKGKAKPVFSAVRRVLTGRARSPKKPTVRLTTSGRSLRVSGTASLTEVVRIAVEQRGQLRFRATIFPDARGRYALRLPPQLGTRGLTVRVSAGWTGSASRRT